MALQLQYKSKQQGILRMAGTVMAVFALLIQPMYGLVAGQVANAISASVSTEAELRQALADRETEINLSDNIGVNNQISIDYSTTFNGGTITALTPGTYGSDDAVVYVSGTDVVFTANNTVFDGNNQGSGNTRRQGVKVYGGATANLNSATIKNAKKSGLHVNGSSVANVKDITTISNGAFYGGLVVSGGGTINIDGKSTHNGEVVPARIDGSGTINDNNEQYTTGNARWLKSAPGVPAITAPASPVTTSTADLIWTAPLTSGNKNAAESYLVSINGGAAETVSGLTHPLTGLADGNYTVTVQSVAKSGLLGGTATHNFTVAIPDTEKPEGSATYAGGYLNPTTNVRYVKNIEDLSFTVNASDNKGVAWATYRAWNVAQSGVEACGNWNTGALTAHIFAAPLQTSKSYTVPGSSIKTCDPSMKWETGSRYQFIHAVYDAAGNESEKFNSTNQLVEIDSTQPIIQILSPLAGSTRNGIVPVEAKVIENGSGIEYVNAKFTDGPSGAQFGTIALTLKPGTTDTYIGQIDTAGHDGKFNLTVSTRDNVKNTRSAKAQNITIDNTAPKISNVQFNKMVNVNSVDHTSASLNGGILEVTFTTDEPLKLVGSQVGMSIPGLPGVPATGWTKVELVNASENRYKASIGLIDRTDTSSVNYEDDFFAGKRFEGVKLYFRTVDTLNNTDAAYYYPDGTFGKSPSKAYMFTIDNSAPEVKSATLNGKLASIAPRDKNGGLTGFNLIGSKFTLGLTVEDATDTTLVRYRVAKVNTSGGTQSNIYRSNWFNMTNTSGSNWVAAEFDTALVGSVHPNSLGDLVTDGTYTIQIETRDSLGNVFSHKYVDISVDKTAPVLTILNPLENQQFLTTQDITVETFVDNTAVRVVAAIDGTTWTSEDTTLGDGNLSSFFTVPAGVLVAGDYTLTVKAYDVIGNETISTRSFRVVEPELFTAPAFFGFGAPIFNSNDDTTQNESTNTGNNSSVLGEQDEEESTTRVLGDEDVVAQTDEGEIQGSLVDDTEVEEGCASFLGLCWYWWVLIVAAVITLAVLIRRAAATNEAEAPGRRL